MVEGAVFLKYDDDVLDLVAKRGEIGRRRLSLCLGALQHTRRRQQATESGGELQEPASALPEDRHRSPQLVRSAHYRRFDDTCADNGRPTAACGVLPSAEPLRTYR